MIEGEVPDMMIQGHRRMIGGEVPAMMIQGHRRVIGQDSPSDPLLKGREFSHIKTGSSL